MPFVSETLDRIVNFSLELNSEIALSTLAERLIEVFGDRKDLAKALLGTNASEKMQIATLASHLGKVASSDSAVRDILTTGHLAKFLSRVDVFRKTSDYRIVGLSNQLFDELSQAERLKFFEKSASLDMDGDLLESVDAQAVLTRERSIFEKFS